MSEKIKRIEDSIQEFHSVFDGVEKKRLNTFTNSHYANLDDVWKAIKPHLLNLKISVIQVPKIMEGDQVLLTTVTNEDGDCIISAMKLEPEKHTLQGMGSALTYLRRYAICCILGIVETEDDDANSLERMTEPMIADRQMGQIYDLIAATESNIDKVNEHIETTWQRSRIEELTYSQAATLISMLKSKLARIERDSKTANE